MYLPLKYTQSTTSALHTKKVKCFLYEDVWRAGGASSLTFLSLPVALMWSHGDLAFFLLPSLQLENVKNFYDSQSSQVVSRSIKTDFSLSSRFKASGTFQNEFKSMYVCVLLLPRPVKARFQTTGQIRPNRVLL